jgi:DNA-3-methyladenine glycosylase I
MSPHAPMQIEPKSLSDYLEVMARGIFQAGISWKVVEAKWPGTVEAFDGFDIEKVSAYGLEDIDRLVGDTRIVRNRKKVEAIVGDAGELIAVDREFGGMRKYFASFPDNDALVKDLHKRFAFMGPMAAHYFLFVVGWEQEHQEAWAMHHGGGAAAAHAHHD